MIFLVPMIRLKSSDANDLAVILLTPLIASADSAHLTGLKFVPFLPHHSIGIHIPPDPACLVQEDNLLR